MQTKKIKAQFTSIGYRFPRGEVAVTPKPFDPGRLAKPLARVYRRVNRNGTLPVNRFNRVDRWWARQLVKVGALGVVREKEA
jgi:hypothetical protein